ncbi:MAG: hypothetical protein M3033_18275 [Acidobacteriota bacterium]|nr:hypothetical protein [Acidobacteriota bacterium]
MKRFLSLSMSFLLLQGVFCFVLLANSALAQTAAAVAKQRETLNNESIIEMLNAGLSDSIIITKIKSSNASFDTSATALQSLKKSGISDAVVMAMVQKASGMEVTASGNASVATNTGSDNATSIIIPDGTEIKVKTTEELNGNKLTEGDPLTFKVVEDVKVNGKVVIAKDTIAKGTVSAAKKNGMMGKGGTLSVRVESTQTVDGQKLKLRAAKSGDGSNNTGSTVALTVLFGPLGLLRHGNVAKIKAGTELTTYADEAKTVMAN